MSHRTKMAIAAVLPCSRSPRARAPRRRPSTWARRRPAQKAFRSSVDVNDFFPHGVTIHVGDSVKFVPTGFHTVDIPRRAGRRLALILADRAVGPGANDAAGAPFWFNGQSNVGFNPLSPGAASVRRPGTPAPSASSPGCRWRGKPKPFTVKFTKTGSYTYYCDIHPGMKGTVKVGRQEHGIPRAKADAKTLNDPGRARPEGRQDAARHGHAAGTVNVGASGSGGVEYFGFFPATQTVQGGHHGELPDVVEDLRGAHGDDRPR